VEYDVEHGTELSTVTFFLTGLAVQIPRCKLTDGPNSPWRFKKTATQNNSDPSNSRIELVLENCPEEDLRYDKKMRCNFILEWVRTGPLPRGSSAVWVVPSLKLLPKKKNSSWSHELEDLQLDPDHRFDRAAAEQFFKIVDDMVLEKASGLCTQIIQNYDGAAAVMTAKSHAKNAREGEPEDKAHIKGTEEYHVALKDFIKRKRNGDYPSLLHDCMCTIHLDSDCNNDTFMLLLSHCT
jgi:hypothetical protein